MNSFDSLKGKKIALMGGAGFIGHNLALKLADMGAEPHVVDGLQVNNLGFYTSGYSSSPNAECYINFLNERLSLLRQARIVMHIIDIRDYHVVSTILNNIQPDAVVHLAAVAHANRANKDPFSTFDHSMRTLENVLDFSRGEGTHVVYLSSSMVYGNFNGEIVSEDRSCDPIGIYGALKYGSEKLVIGYNQVFNLPYTIIRPSALYGERCVSQRVGQVFIENALIGKDLVVSGDGTDTLDFTYIDDLVQGLMLAIAKPEAQGEIFNMTFGAARTLNQMVALLREHFPDIKVTSGSRDNLMPERGALSNEKACRLLGYKPQFPLEKGFARYIEWYKNFFKNNMKLFYQE